MGERGLSAISAKCNSCACGQSSKNKILESEFLDKELFLNFSFLLFRPYGQNFACWMIFAKGPHGMYTEGKA